MVRARYIKSNFLPSLTLDEIAEALEQSELGPETLEPWSLAVGSIVAIAGTR
ncbi:hypothetical protein D3C72_1937460 [compost metagenome]